jgi:DNA ligase-1
LKPTKKSRKTGDLKTPDKKSPLKDYFKQDLEPLKKTSPEKTPTKKSPELKVEKKSPEKSPEKPKSEKKKRPEKTLKLQTVGAGQKGADYNPRKSKYHPINDAFWKKGEK